MFKILVVSNIYPFPADTGKKIVMNGFLDYFHSRFGENSVEWIIISNKNIEEKNISSVGFHNVDVPSSMRRLLSVFFYSFILRRKSIQESILYTPALGEMVCNEIKKSKPDLIMFDTIRAAQYGLPVGYKGDAFLYMDDLFSVRYEKMLNVLRNGDAENMNVLGNFSNFIPRIIRPAVQKLKFFQKYLLGLEKKLTEKSEIQTSENFPLNILLNAEEVALMKARSPGTHVVRAKPILPKPASNSFLRKYDGAFTFIFIGVLNYAPNELAILKFLKEVVPNVIEKCPEFRLRIIGKHASDELKDVVSCFSENVVLEGFVPDLSDALATCCGMLIPLTFGTGIKLKTLEALSYGVPVISTSVGTEGIPLQSGKDCFINDNFDDFLGLMVFLKDRKNNEMMSENAKKFFEENYSKEVIFSEYDQMFKKYLLQN